MSLADEIPRLRSHRVALEALGSAANAGLWLQIDPELLREATTGRPPPQATRVRTAWTTREWRILFQMDDARPWATLVERDGPLWTEEVVEVFIDPVGDLESYFEIEVNPLGAVTDLVLRRTSSGWRKEFGWHAAGFQSRVQTTATGWEAEVSIPFAAIVPDGTPGGRVWRVNFLRVDRPLGAGSEAELSAWSPTGGRNFHRPERFGAVEFC